MQSPMRVWDSVLPAGEECVGRETPGAMGLIRMHSW